jgi:hypothetical protein
LRRAPRKPRRPARGVSTHRVAPGAGSTFALTVTPEATATADPDLRRRIGGHPLAQLRRAARNAAAPSLLLPLYAPAGLLVGIVGGVPFILLRAFPPAIRFSGVSFSYNLADAVFGGLTPIVIPLALAWDRRAHVCYLLALCALGTAVGIALWRGALPAPMPAKNRS